MREFSGGDLAPLNDDFRRFESPFVVRLAAGPGSALEVMETNAGLKMSQQKFEKQFATKPLASGRAQELVAPSESGLVSAFFNQLVPDLVQAFPEVTNLTGFYRWLMKDGKTFVGHEFHFMPAVRFQMKGEKVVIAIHFETLQKHMARATSNIKTNISRHDALQYVRVCTASDLEDIAPPGKVCVGKGNARLAPFLSSGVALRRTVRPGSLRVPAERHDL